MAALFHPRQLTYIALFTALGIVLPIGFHAFGLGGRIFLPMHIPVLLAGFIAGPVSGLVVGLLTPGLSSLLTGMPPNVIVPAMTVELAIYGLIAGICYQRLRLNVYLSLFIAMIAGRLMFAGGLVILGLFIDLPYKASALFAVSGAFVTGLPGIAVQILLIPLVVAGVRRQHQPVPSNRPTSS